MTSKERMLLAMKNRQPDMVPVAPDISCMIPCRLTGQPFWDICFYEKPPLWKAYLNAVKKYGFDGWFTYGRLGKSPRDQRSFRDEIISRTEERMTVRTWCTTPEGELWQETVYYRDQPPTLTRKYIKDLKKDFHYLKYFFPDPEGSDAGEFQAMKQEVGNLGVVGIWLPYPVLMFYLRDGGYERAVYDYYDNYVLVKEYAEMFEEWAGKMVREIIKAKPDFLFTGESGTLTLQSEDIFRDVGLPVLKNITKASKEAGIPSMLHSCGKEKELVRICAEETDLNCINPLEIPPMGDCDLKELKQKYGDRLSLMGNLHTTDVMFRGTVKDVEKAAIKAIDDAAAKGGFILSTGDQCGRDTPDENIYMMVETARTHGRY